MSYPYDYAQNKRDPRMLAAFSQAGSDENYRAGQVVECPALRLCGSWSDERERNHPRVSGAIATPPRAY
jgi:hypothetical protein